MNPFKKLAGDTAIYGMSSIVGRFLNWWLVPYYSFIFIPEVYGVVTNLYSYVAFFLVLLLYGMETSFFRFASKSKNPENVYSTSLISVFSTSAMFVLLAAAFSKEIASFINYPEHSEYVVWLAIILGIDAFTAIPFARLRLNNRPVKFAAVKVINIAFNIGFNLFFLSVCPKILQGNPDSIVRIVYSPEIGVGYVFIANLLASIITFILLLPEIFKVSLKFEKELLAQMLSYGFPILIVGLAGMVNQNIDKILIPFLVPEDQNPMFQLGVYGANYKLAVLMNMFIQAFRYAFEPFFFSRGESKDDPQVYATVMKYFVIFGLFIFIGMVLFIDVITLVISSGYHEGLKVVPLILMANLFFGIYFALSLWYKLKDMTRYGAYMALTGAAITLALNFLLIPVFGYMGSAIAVFICYLAMMIMSYFIGQKYYPIPYDLKRIATYFLIAVAIYGLSWFSASLPTVLKFSVNTLLLFAFVYAVYKLEKKQLKRLFNRNLTK
ncbi:Membrane protein involved in the export of O-antigen and teichoic acid [Mariniphaga anaerophila]|uniref:Membrane protein involved in the export of O-antigen and teichoic acid n=1 Tax=Mariniphaga anaerophila TaxID=1484053 RepID=A0A1M5EKB5_9BACT|nr:oligosaccharide flippase family protein [Mariniphaga anaerophila]SHF79689.1 Membrane protein involved in the export of O-antigen and teichoic acid [Mariniphaga anaerophila]